MFTDEASYPYSVTPVLTQGNSKVRQLRPILLVVLFLGLGCGSDVPLAGSASTQQPSDEQFEFNEEDRSAQKGVTQGTATNKPVTRQELDQYRASFKSASAWHYGERADGELAGVWTSVDGDGHRISFDLDGVKGSFRGDFNGNPAVGLYSISDDGLIVTYSKRNGVGIGTHFRVDGQTIIGPKGPNPSAQWKRIDKKE